MALFYEELDFQPTPLGELILRRRSVAALDGAEVYEVKLADEMLMSSLINFSELALARRVLSRLTGGALDVLVGGLGLGFTAQAALEFDAVRQLTVIELLPPVIAWHRQGLIPWGPALMNDPRLRVVEGDFFRWAQSSRQENPLPEVAPTWDAILLDIDHSPEFLLTPENAAFYEAAGLARLAAHVRPGGYFALWSADPPDENLVARLATVFAEATTETIEFYNPLVATDDTNTLYLARAARDGE